MRWAAAAMVAALGGCASLPYGTLTPEQAVIRAAAAPVAGRFVMTVRATGRQDFRLYLNSQVDYRDQRNLSVEVPAAVELELARRFSADVPATLRDHMIVVTGVARRVRIDFTADGRPTGKYYFQTHVALTEAGQLAVLRR